MRDALEVQAASVIAHRLTAGQRAATAIDEGREDLAHQDFPYRDAMEAALVAARRERVGPNADGAMMHLVAVTLWQERAKAGRVNRKMVMREQYELVTKAQAQKAAPTLRDLRRTMAVHANEHPDIDIRIPESSRKLERRGV